MRLTLLFLLGTVLFAVAFGQAPLYYSNQNQYFLAGLAQAGEGHLRDDWLVTTRDPTPVFTALVAFTARWLHPCAVYVYYALLLGVYAAAMLALFAWLAGPEMTARRWPIFAALFFLFHAALPRWCAYRWLGLDYPWYFQAGVASQYVLGAMFQPSTFGILMVVAVALFVRGRPWLAVVCTALSATVHSTYLLTAGLLTLGFLAALLAEGRVRQALTVGGLALLLILPITIYVLVAFGPTSSEAFAEAQDILVNFRIPHHTRPDLWLGDVAILQVSWMVVAIVMVRGTRLFAMLAVPLALAVLLTVVTVQIGNNTLALLFPWRISSVLVPVATTVILTRLTAIRALPLDGAIARTASALAVVALVVAGAWIMATRQGYRTDDEEEPVMNFVRRTLAPGDLYLLPVRVPRLTQTTYGGFSSDFKPLPEKRVDQRIIPLDFQRFRLWTGAPVYVDFKAIPYKDVEVIEWRDRIRFAENAVEKLRLGGADAIVDDLRRRGITQVVLPAGRELHDARLSKVYDDSNYQIYRISAAALDWSP
jgi:hypothetical protein